MNGEEVWVDDGFVGFDGMGGKMGCVERGEKVVEGKDIWGVWGFEGVMEKWGGNIGVWCWGRGWEKEVVWVWEG